MNEHILDKPMPGPPQAKPSSNFFRRHAPGDPTVTHLARRLAMLAALVLVVNGFGCGDSTDSEITTTPDNVISPQATDESPLGPLGDPDGGSADIEEPGTTLEADPAMEASAEPTPEPEPAPDPEPEPLAAESTSDIMMSPVSLEDFKDKIAEGDAKYTLVDCWATWCGPCKENFPHVLEMHEKYGDKGLKVASLSFDKGTGDADFDAKQVAAAHAFLGEINAGDISNYVLEVENIGDAFEAFDITTIPAVFVYDAEGNEVKRYTWDDPNDQFTYEQVEKEVSEMLGNEENSD